ncbi:MAG: hypothetical protein WCF72_14485, partial [Pseudolabrys sp.]
IRTREFFSILLAEIFERRTFESCRDLTFHSTSCQERVTVATHRSASRRQQLAYVYFEDEPGRRSAAKLLSNRLAPLLGSA